MTRTLFEITDDNYSMRSCGGIDLRNIDVAHDCYSRMHASFIDINNASDGILKAFVQGENIRDPWGSPYFFDENEGENPADPCRPEVIRSAGPDGFVGGGDDIQIQIEPIRAACH